MGGLVSGITDAVGLTNTKAEKRAAKLAEKNSDFAAAIAAESIEFQKEQYADWKAVYGDLQENLGNYYKSLTPERTTAMGLQNVQAEYQAAIKDINTTAAQRGIAGSDLETAAMNTARIDLAKNRATVRNTAASTVAQEQAGFLSIGLGQGTQMLQNVGSAYNTSVSSRTNLAGNYIGQQTAYGQANINAMGDVVGAGMGWASGGTSRGVRA